MPDTRPKSKAPTMWEQPPSTVWASEARPVSAGAISELEFSYQAVLKNTGTSIHF